MIGRAEAAPPGDPDIHKMISDGSGQKRLTDDPASDDDPTFSPKGKKIAFATLRDGTTDFGREIYTMSADTPATYVDS